MRASLLFLILVIALTSCSSLQLKQRRNQDILLNASNFKQLRGTYSQYLDHFRVNSLLLSFSKIHIDSSMLKNRPLKIAIEPIDAKNTSANFYIGDSLILKSVLRGKYSKGYFKMKRRWTCKAFVGPLFWGLGDNSTVMGLSNKNDLVILSVRGGVAIIIAIPCFASGGQVLEIFQRE